MNFEVVSLSYIYFIFSSVQSAIRAGELRLVSTPYNHHGERRSCPAIRGTQVIPQN